MSVTELRYIGLACSSSSS